MRMRLMILSEPTQIPKTTSLNWTERKSRCKQPLLAHGETTISPLCSRVSWPACSASPTCGS